MSWMVDSPLTYFQKFCVNVVKSGEVPRHVAFIMDGNRRYAKKVHVYKAVGHTRGFDKLAETLQWCLELGIREVTVYAFSIENFKRSSEEVETLMQLARDKYKRLVEEKDRLMADGVCIRVIGNLELLPADIRKSIAEAVIMTKENDKVFLNVAFAYTSRDEITNAVKVLMDAVETNKIDVGDINEQLLSDCLYTNHSPDPDLLVRTSGEVRCSDFLLWQIWNTNVCFAEVLWPEFCIWHLLASVVQYQRCCRDIKVTKRKPSECKSLKAQQFLKHLDQVRLAQLKLYAST